MISGLVGALALTVLSSITPHQVYYPVNRPMMLSISPGTNRELVLLTAQNAELGRVAIPDRIGDLDLAQTFRRINEQMEMCYLQLLTDGVPSGPALALQPMVRRASAVIRRSQGGPKVESWNEPPPNDLNLTGFRAYVERDPVLHTTLGDIRLKMRPDEAPNTVWSFISLVDGGYYTQTPWHRIVGKNRNGDPFVIQAGDPTGSGSGGPGYRIFLEPSTISHDFGVISMAREGNDINTGGSQFFICLSRAGTQFLDVQYTSFGHTIEGGEVVLKLAAVKVDQRDRPVEMPYITNAELLDAAPRWPGILPEWLGGPPPPSIPEPVVELVVEEPVIEPVPEPMPVVVEPAPVVETQPEAPPVPDPATDPVTDPAADPVDPADPANDPATDPDPTTEDPEKPAEDPADPADEPSDPPSEEPEDPTGGGGGGG